MATSFSLSLIVNHACNLRCSYCYTGEKFNRRMPDHIARRSIERAIASVEKNASLDLGFFGGEPLLEADSILSWTEHARAVARLESVQLGCSMTTNGTIVSPEAWEVFMLPEMDLTISCDGNTEAQDKHRRFVRGKGSAAIVHQTIKELVEAGKDLQVLLVVRPDNAATFPRQLEFLKDLGVRRIVLSLDLWTKWSRADVLRLDRSIGRGADLWRGWLPDIDINWYSEKAVAIAGIDPDGMTAACGFGVSEIAVAPSGNLYPCERLVGEDNPENPMRLPGNASDGSDFDGFSAAPFRSASACSSCPIQSSCGTSCRCSNYVRTGDVAKPDGLLCMFDKSCYRETARVWQQPFRNLNQWKTANHEKAI